MPKQSFEEKIKAGKAKFKSIREGNFQRVKTLRPLGIALGKDVRGVVHQTYILPNC